jgi:hypothetical protein
MSTDHCPGSAYFERADDKMDAHIDAVKAEIREYTKGVNDLCGQMRILIKVACYMIAPLIICICVIAMGEKLTEEVGKHIPAAHAENITTGK